MTPEARVNRSDWQDEDKRREWRERKALEIYLALWNDGVSHDEAARVSFNLERQLERYPLYMQTDQWEATPRHA